MSKQLKNVAKFCKSQGVLGACCHQRLMCCISAGGFEELLRVQLAAIQQVLSMNQTMSRPGFT